MAKIKKIIFILLTLIIIGLIAYISILLYQKQSSRAGVLIVTLSPQKALVTINSKTYSTRNGFLKIKLMPQEYTVIFSYPGYSVVNKHIEIKANETLDLGKIYLFPASWPKEILINDNNIVQLFGDPGLNHFIFIKKENKNYDWYLYNRNTKENQKFYQTSILPQQIIYSPDSKKIIALLKNEEWKLIFLPKRLIDKDINLNNEFTLALKQAKLQIPQTLILKQIAFIPQHNEDVLIRTNKGVYQFKYLERVINQIINNPVSPFILDNNSLYFIKNNGLFTQIDLNTLEEHSLSLMSFTNLNENLDDIIIKKSPINKTFLIITPNKTAFIIKEETNLPINLGQMIINGEFSLSGNKVLFYTVDNKIMIYDLKQNKTIELKLSLKSASEFLPHWFLNDNYLLFLDNNQLKIYNLENQEIWPVTNDLKNTNFIYDPVLNYIFYISDKGVEKISI